MAQQRSPPVPDTRSNQNRPLNTMERMVLCCFLQQDIGALLDICESKEALTARIGPPPPEIKEALDHQISKVIETIFKDAVRA